jgi:hypothetical protein
VEATVPGALSRGSFFFADIQRNQVDTAGLALLRFVAAQEERAAVSREALIRRFPDELEWALAFLCQRELIEPADGGYRLQVELIRRWFTQKWMSKKMHCHGPARDGITNAHQAMTCSPSATGCLITSLLEMPRSCPKVDHVVHANSQMLWHLPSTQATFGVGSQVGRVQFSYANAAGGHTWTIPLLLAHAHYPCCSQPDWR